MESMTGYAYIESENELFSYSIEVKSLNSRYLETSVYLPRQLRSEEASIDSLLKSFFQRGKVEFNLEITRWNEEKPVSLNTGLIKKYYNELQKVRDSLGMKGELPFESVLLLDGLTQRSGIGLSPKIGKEILKSSRTAVDKNIDMRKKEGKAILKDIKDSLRHIKKGASAISTASAKSAKHKKEMLIKKISDIYPEMDDSRMFSEIALMLDRLDVNEEIVRLGDHIKKFLEIAAENEHSGRRLDFLAQEMFREINTIGSKSNSSEISHIVVEMKNHIDRIREHCRNIV